MEKGITGWREWVALPDLGVEAIKAKVDTGAKTSAVHVWQAHHFEKDGADWLRFYLHPGQNDDLHRILCEAPLKEMREVTSSNGARQRRFVIETPLRIGEKTYPIEITLTNRDEMGFRMLLGRQALRKRWLVDPGKSYLTRPDIGDAS